MITIEQLRAGVGFDSTELSDAELQEALDMAEQLAGAYCDANGCPKAGAGYEVAVKYYARANAYRTADAKGLKPAARASASESMSSDLGTAIDGFLKLAEAALANHKKATQSSPRDRYFKHLRGGRGAF